MDMRKHPTRPQERKTTLPNTEGRKAAQKRYNAKPEQKKRRAARNATRREAIASGRVHVGDGKDIDHKDGNPKNKAKSNLRVQSPSTNRSNNRR